MWEWEECNGSDVVTGSTQILPSHHALIKVCLGRTLTSAESCYTFNPSRTLPLSVLVLLATSLEQLLWPTTQADGGK